MKKILTAIMGMAFMAGTAHGVLIGQGTRELAVQGDMQFASEVGTAFEIDLRLGQFVIHGVQVGILASVADNDIATQWGIGAFTEYNVDLGTELVPFAGLAAKYSYLDPDVGDSNDGAVFGAAAGVKYFFAENIAISLNYLFEWATDDVFRDKEEAEDTNHSIQLGMRFFF